MKILNILSLILTCAVTSFINGAAADIKESAAAKTATLAAAAASNTGAPTPKKALLVDVWFSVHHGSITDRFEGNGYTAADLLYTSDSIETLTTAVNSSSNRSFFGGRSITPKTFITKDPFKSATAFLQLQSAQVNNITAKTIGEIPLMPGEEYPQILLVPAISK